MIEKIRNYLHCITCKYYRECPIRYCPTEGPIYINIECDGKHMTMSNPIECKKPLKNN